MDTSESMPSHVEPWIRELRSKWKIMLLKKKLLEAAVLKGDFDEVEDRIAELRKMVREAESVDVEILEDSEKFKSSLAEIADTVAVIQSAIRIDSSNPASRKSTLPTPHQYDHSEGLKLKPLKLPIFSGNPEEWQPFWEQYSALVDDNPKYSDVSKHRLLLSECLKGTALRAVDGYTPSAENYPKVVVILKERFGDPAKLASCFYARLEKLPRADSAASQRHVFDEIQKILANLNALGVPTDEEYVRERVLQKFSRSTLKWVWQTLRIEASLMSLSSASADSNASEVAASAFAAVPSTAISRTSVSTLMAAIGAIVTRDDDINHYTGSDFSRPSKTSQHKGIPSLMAGASNASASSSSDTRRNPIGCIFCNLKHPSEECRKFGTLQKRKERLVSLRRCLRCGEEGHYVQRCQLKKECSNCGKTGHGPILCIETILKSRKQNKGKSISGALVSASESGIDTLEFSGTFMETFMCEIRSYDGNYVPVRGVLDSGCGVSYISERLVKKLRLKTGKKLPSNICSFGSRKTVCQNTSKVEVTLRNHQLVFEITTLQSISCITGNAVTCPAPPVVKTILKDNLAYADPSIFQSHKRPLDILIGIDLYNKFVNLSQVRRLPLGIVLKGSFFGWIPSGKISVTSLLLPSTSDSLLPSTRSLTSIAALATKSTFPSIKNLNHEDKKLDELCALNWSLEVIGIRSKELESIDDEIIENFRKTVRRDNGRYVVRWPWKSENPSLPSNFRVSMARLRNTIHNNTLENLMECEKNFREQLALGIIEPAPSVTPYLKHYIPWKAVFRKNKIRIVYDASARTSNGKSLNDMINCGPKLIGDLVNLLINFRIHKVALTADIEKAFLMVGLNEVDRDVTRFLWLRDLKAGFSPNNLVIYRFTRTCFGVIASPFLLNIVIQDHLTSDNKYLTIARNSLYVDNLLVSTTSTIEAINLHNTVKPNLASGGFNLRDWTSNDREFVTSVPDTLPIDSEPLSILGLGWNRASDSLQIMSHKDISGKPLTKRLLLSYINGIYDPLGLVAPSVLQLRLLLQECWKEKSGWDEILNASTQAKWLKLQSETKDKISTPFPRRYWSFQNPGNVSLHIFCDASKSAYACCAYLVFTDTLNGNFASALVTSKSRITPTSCKYTIPRLELMGVLIGKRLGKYLLSKIRLEIQRLVIWTDATTVIHWLNSSSVQAQFVEDRLHEVRESLDSLFPAIHKDFSIRYVPTECNPADLATRGTTSEKLFINSLWWNGPDWLPYPQLWPSPPPDVGFYSSLPNGTLSLLVPNTLPPDYFLPDAYERRFSSWDKYARLFGLVIRFCADKLNIPNFDSDTDTFQRGERTLIRSLQFKYFPKELLKLRKDLQPDTNLQLFMDEYGLIRCKGRLSNASFPWETLHPILLPRESPLTCLYIRKIHEENMHSGCDHVLAKLREKFWITKGRAKVKSVLHKCSTCRKWSGGSYQLPPMPALPWVRVTECSPFLHSGIDYFGPINCYKDDGTSLSSVHVALFVCLVTRAVHLELALDKSADEFLMAFIRFTSRRGVPKFVFSDNGTNLKFVQRLVGSETHITDVDLRRYFSTNNIRWKFAIPGAEWQRGAIERLIGLIKPCLKKSFGRKQILNYVSLSTALCDVENIVNSRPLTYLSEEKLQPLTPNHFLRLRSVNANNFVEVSQHRIPRTTRKDILHQWKETNAIVQDFWSAFRGLYLLSLRSGYHSQHKHSKGSLPFSPRINDIVLIQHPSAPRSDWAIGKIEKLDKRQASAHVRTENIITIKPINQLFPFEFSDRTVIDNNLPF